MIKVPSQKILAAVQQPQEGELAFVEKEERYFKYTNGVWAPVTKEDMFSLGTLYEINKQIISQLAPLDEEGLAAGLETIKQFKGTHLGSKYFMLLSNEIRYYTLFATKSRRATNLFEDEIMDCLRNLGEVKSISLTEDEQAVEIWIEREGDVNLFYLFDYDSGVIECQ